MTWLLKIAGFACVALGFAGAFLPLLPTTPFLLLAMYLFARSSPVYRDKLLSNRVLGPYLAAYTAGGGMSRRIKIRVLVLLWGAMVVTTVFFISVLYIRLLLLLITAAVTVHIIMMRGVKR